MKAQADEIVGQGSRDVDFVAAHGMGEADAVSLKRNAAVGVAARSTVLEVALDGAADGRQLRPDLVLAAGNQIHLQQPVALAGSDDTVLEHRLLVTLARNDAHAGLVALLHALEVVGERALLLGGAIAHDGPVGLVDIALAEQLIHAGQPFAGLGHDDQAAGRSVDAVGHAQEHVAGFVIFLLDPRFHRIDERRVAGAVALHQLAGGFVHDDDVVVFIYYFHDSVHATMWVADVQNY